MKNGIGAKKTARRALTIAVAVGVVGGAAGGSTSSIAYALQRAPAASGQPTSTAPLVFRGVTVVDVLEGRSRVGQTVVVVGTRISALGPADQVNVPRGARVINSRGKYLIPGLWDMHIHVMQYPEIFFPLLIANGVTGVRDAGSTVPLAVQSQWKREIAAGTRVGPRLLLSGPAIDEAAPSETDVSGGDEGVEHLRVPRDAAERVVDSLRAAGADLIKTYDLSRDMYFAVAAAARRRGMLFGGHLPSSVNGLEAADSGARLLDHRTYLRPNVCGDHSPEFDAEACAAVGRRLHERGTWMVSGPNRVPHTISRAEARARLNYWPVSIREPLLSDSMVRVMDSRCGCVAQAPDADGPVSGLYAFPSDSVDSRSASAPRAGVPFLAGTDGAFFLTTPSVPGFALQDEVIWLGEAGLSPLAALRSATLHPAQALGLADSLGTVETGKVADLVLLDQDPLADIHRLSTVHGVLANGRYYDRAALDRLLADVRRIADE